MIWYNSLVETSVDPLGLLQSPQSQLPHSLEEVHAGYGAAASRAVVLLRVKIQKPTESAVGIRLENKVDYK